MKKFSWMMLAVILFLAACEFDVPLVVEHDIPIDPNILGNWESVSEDEDEMQLRILKFSDTEYMIHDSDNNGDTYFRAYAINVGGVSAVQIEFLGDDKRPVKSDAGDRYMVASYKVVDGMLEMRFLNSELVDKELTDTESLRAAFIEHKENPGLFNDPGLFRRLQD